MSDTEELLATRRSRRSTAGNRMQAALAEMAVEDTTKEVDDDVDFVVVRDEEDIFESDFESTDEEAAQEDEDRAVRDEENQAIKAARAKVAKAAAIAHDRQKVTFNPQLAFKSKSTPAGPAVASTPARPKVKRRVSLGFAINAETGEVMETGTGKRQSQRKHTVMNTSETVNRIRKSQERRAAATPKKVKGETRQWTQDELISRALDNEEGNLVEHRDYLRLEEEKRKRARVIRMAVDGPVLRWISKVENEKVVVEPPAPPIPFMQYSYPTPGTRSVTPMPFPYMASHPYGFPYAVQNMSPSTPLSTAPFQYAQTPAPAPAPTPVHRTEKVTKNYVVHELGQFENAPRPTWGNTMESMFGDHVKWEDLRVYVGKGRPLVRPKAFCPITGWPASYLDPRTGVPFANIHAFETITRILNHEYVWSDALGCYVGEQSSKDPDG